MEYAPEDDEFLLRFNKKQSVLLIEAANRLPENLQPQCKDRLSSYMFKNGMTNFLLRSKAAPEVVSHYLKHVLSPKEYDLMAANMKLSLGRTSQRYAISTDLVPYIQKHSLAFWSKLENENSAFLSRIPMSSGTE